MKYIVEVYAFLGGDALLISSLVFLKCARVQNFIDPGDGLRKQDSDGPDQDRPRLSSRVPGDGAGPHHDVHL
eukprot:scaffold209220_cov21-Tisochrysis_lutea.AAC.1